MDKPNFIILKASRNNSDEPFRLNVNTIKKYRPWYNTTDPNKSSTVFYISDGKNPSNGISKEGDTNAVKSKDPDEDLQRIIIPINIEHVDEQLGVLDLREKL